MRRTETEHQHAIDNLVTQKLTLQASVDQLVADLEQIQDSIDKAHEEEKECQIRINRLKTLAELNSVDAPAPDPGATQASEDDAEQVRPLRIVKTPPGQRSGIHSQ